jgi:ubiquitin C-terminal hydrolase
MSLTFYTPRKLPLPSGLQNKGATCWLNSLLQLVLSLPALHILSDEIIHGSTRNKFIKLLAKLYDDPSKGENLNAIYKYIMDNYGSLSPTGLTSQECALEGYDHIIDSLKNDKLIRLFTTVYLDSFDCPKCHKEMNATRDIAYRTHIAKPPINQEDFEEYVLNRVNMIESYKCDECHRVCENIPRISRLRQVNEILVFSFPKFEEKRVYWFPQNFSIPYAKNNQNGRLEYKLVAKIEHSGTMNGGHYYAHCLRKTPANGEQCVLLNDSSVAVGNLNPSAETFIIAYHVARFIAQ